MIKTDSIQLGQKTGLYIASSGKSGLGLFCSQQTTPNEVIETCCAIVFNEQDAINIDKTHIYNYYFSMSFLDADESLKLGIQDKEKAGCLVLGALSMANHSGKPNAIITKEVCNSQIVFTLKAITSIAPHEEITISYGHVWFPLTDQPSVNKRRWR